MLRAGEKRRTVRRWAAALAVTGMLFGLAAPQVAATPEGPGRIALKADQTRLMVMIELKSAPMVSVDEAMATTRAAHASTLKAEHARLRQHLSDAGVAYKRLSEHTTLFNGMAVEVRASDMAAIAELPGVKGVHVIRRHSMPEPQLSSSVSMIGAPAAWAGNPSAGVPGVNGAGIRVAIIDTGLSVGHRT